MNVDFRLKLGLRMSNASGGSSGSSSVRPSGRYLGVPKRCWCGEKMVALISKSDHNPYRRYYRCSYAAAKKLMNDNHIFKWVDEALLNEVETLQLENAKLVEEIKAVRTESLELEKMVFEKVEMRIEKEIFERVEDVLGESSSTMKKMMILVVIGCMIMIGCSKLLG